MMFLIACAGFALGILTGITLAGIAVVIVFTQRSTIERTLNQVNSRLMPKGSIIEPDNEELAAFLDTLKNENSLP